MTSYQKLMKAAIKAVKELKDFCDANESEATGWGDGRVNHADFAASYQAKEALDILQGPLKEKYKHLKRGSSYYVIGEARVQCEEPLKDMDTVLVYRDQISGHMSVRKPEEFHDGRFKKVEFE